MSPCSSLGKVGVDVLGVGEVLGGVGIPTPPTVKSPVSPIQQCSHCSRTRQKSRLLLLDRQFPS